MNKNIEYISVSDLNRYLYYKFDQDLALQNVYIEGELSNVKLSGKHYYFSLKDQNSEISAMFFYPANLSLNFELKDGISVQVVGKVQVYQKRGSYALIVNKIVECGVGILYQRYLELKSKLEREGLFDERHKLQIPDYAETIGIITASTGEAIHDIISTFNRRFPLAKLKLFPALVQGVDAPKDLIRALNLAYNDNSLDVLIIGRGGGSFEDLNCFNDEFLARKLYESKIPTISAVGHEGDYTICDFVCSFRAPTPTGAAMRLTKEKNDVIDILVNYSKRIKNGMKNKLINNFKEWNILNNSYYLAHFDEVIENKEQILMEMDKHLALVKPSLLAKKLDENIRNLTHLLNTSFLANLNNYESKILNLSERIRKELVVDKISSFSEQIKISSNQIESYFLQNVTNYENLFMQLIEKSRLLNPLNIISKGYAIVYKNDIVIDNVKSLSENDKIKIKFKNGIVDAVVNRIEEDKYGE